MDFTVLSESVYYLMVKCFRIVTSLSSDYWLVLCLYPVVHFLLCSFQEQLHRRAMKNVTWTWVDVLLMA